MDVLQLEVLYFGGVTVWCGVLWCDVMQVVSQLASSFTCCTGAAWKLHEAVVRVCCWQCRGHTVMQV
jgi:hypothetical protein